MHRVSLPSNSKNRKKFVFLSYKIPRKDQNNEAYLFLCTLSTSHILIPNHSPLPGTPCLSSLRTLTNQNFFFQEFPVRFLTIEGFPSNGSMEILNNGTWKFLCVANWNDVERNSVCQAQGYNGSSLELHSHSGTNSSGNITHSCEYLTQNCENKINTEINCSGIIKKFFSPKNES